MQTIAPCIFLICLQNISAALSICCNEKLNTGVWSWVKITFKLWEYKLTNITQLYLKCHLQWYVHTTSDLNKWRGGDKKQQEVFKTWKVNYSFYFQLILYFLQTFLSPPSANIPLTACSYSIQSYTNMFGTFYSWALWSWQFQLSHHHWWQQTTLLPTADTLNSVKLQASFASSPTRCLDTCNTILWRAVSSWTANTLIPHWYHPTFYFKW